MNKLQTIFVRFWPIFLMVVLLASCRQAPSPEPVEGSVPEPVEGTATSEISSFAGTVPAGALARLGRGSLNVLTFSPDELTIAAGSDVGLYLYAADTLAELWHIPATTPIISLAFSPDGQWLASGSANGAVNLIRAADGRVVQGSPSNSNDTNSVNALAWHVGQADETGPLLAAGFNDGNVTISRLHTADKNRPDGAPPIELLGSLARSQAGVTAMVFNPNGRVLATGDRTGRINLWDAGTLEWFAVLEGHEGDNALLDLAWSPDEDRLLSGARDEQVILWDPLTFLPIQHFEGSAEPLAISYSADGKFFTVAGADGQVNRRESADPYQPESVRELNSELSGATISSMGDKIAAFSPSGELALWPLTGDSQPRPFLTLSGHIPALASMTAQAWSPDGQLLATALDSQVILWDTDTWEPAHFLAFHGSGITRLAWSPNGQELASAGRDDVAIIWDLESDQPRLRLAEHTHNVSDLAYSPDGKRLVTAGSLDNQAIIWDLENGQILARIPGEGDGVWSVAWSPDGHNIGLGLNSGHIQLWDVADPTEPELLTTMIRHSAWVSGLAYSSDGSFLASVGADGRMVLTRLEDEKGKTYGGGHLGPIRGVGYSPDGAMLATAGIDGQTIIWDAGPEASTAPLAVYKGHTGGINDVGWSPDSRLVATAADDGTAIIWQIVTSSTEE